MTKLNDCIAALLLCSTEYEYPTKYYTRFKIGPWYTAHRRSHQEHKSTLRHRSSLELRCKWPVFFHDLTSNRSWFRSFGKAFHCVAEKTLSVCLTRTDLSAGEFDPCSTTSTFRRPQPVCRGSIRVCADPRTCSRSHGLRWNRKGP